MTKHYTHYTFWKNKVTGHEDWRTVKPQLDGAYFYSPNDSHYLWGTFGHDQPHGWKVLPMEEVPKEFRTQLLLMGVPC